MVAKDFCASGGTGATEDFCASDCAKATVESDIRTTDSIKRRDFMVSFSLSFFTLGSGSFAGVLKLRIDQL
jgi:hypothetical protein